MIDVTGIKAVHRLLRDRQINPTGEFDKAGRWHTGNDDLISVRSPSRRFPYSEMNACRTLKYCRAVAEKFGCKTENELRQKV